MKRKIIIIWGMMPFLVGLFSNANCQKAYKTDLGIGVVALDFGLNASYYRKVNFYVDKQATSVTFTLNTWDGQDSVPIVPFDNLGAPPFLYFRCLDSTKTMYHIVSNDSTGISLWIRKEKGNAFLTWFAYFKGFNWIVFGGKGLHTCPNDTCQIANKSSSLSNTAQILRMQGDWMKIETKSYSNLEDDLPAPHRIIGWIRWRKENSLLVNGYNNE